jgi:hypothetical protein
LDKTLIGGRYSSRLTPALNGTEMVGGAPIWTVRQLAVSKTRMEFHFGVPYGHPTDCRWTVDVLALLVGQNSTGNGALSQPFPSACRDVPHSRLSEQA